MIDDCKKRMPLSPKVMTTKELFEGRRYVIPEYQRDYVWDKEENIKPFVQAIAEGVAKSEDVFLGTTLFRETEDGKFEVMAGSGSPRWRCCRSCAERAEEANCSATKRRKRKSRKR